MDQSQMIIPSERDGGFYSTQFKPIATICLLIGSLVNEKTGFDSMQSTPTICYSPKQHEKNLIFCLRCAQQKKEMREIFFCRQCFSQHYKQHSSHIRVYTVQSSDVKSMLSKFYDFLQSEHSRSDVAYVRSICSRPFAQFDYSLFHQQPFLKWLYSLKFWTLSGSSQNVEVAKSTITTKLCSSSNSAERITESDWESQLFNMNDELFKRLAKGTEKENAALRKKKDIISLIKDININSTTTDEATSPNILEQITMSSQNSDVKKYLGELVLLDLNESNSNHWLKILLKISQISPQFQSSPSFKYLLSFKHWRLLDHQHLHNHNDSLLFLGRLGEKYVLEDPETYVRGLLDFSHQYRNPYILTALAYGYLALNDLDQAIEYLKQAQALLQPGTSDQQSPPDILEKIPYHFRLAKEPQLIVSCPLYDKKVNSLLHLQDVLNRINENEQDYPFIWKDRVSSKIPEDPFLKLVNNLEYSFDKETLMN